MPAKPTLVKCLVWDVGSTLWRGILLEDRGVTVPAAIREAIVELGSQGMPS